MRIWIISVFASFIVLLFLASWYLSNFTLFSPLSSIPSSFSYSIDLLSLKYSRFPEDFSLSTSIEYIQTYQPSIVSAQPYSLKMAVRDTAILLRIQQGLLFTNHKPSFINNANFQYSTQVILDTNSSQIIDLGCWENILFTEKTTSTRANLKIYKYDSIITYMVPWGELYSHLVATMLPKLNFTCTFITFHKHIHIIVNTLQAQELICTYCPTACIDSNYIDRFIMFPLAKRGNIGFLAKNLYFPLFFENNRNRGQFKNPTMSLYHNWMNSVPNISFTAEDNLPLAPLLRSLNMEIFHANTTRSIVYMPRKKGGSRFVANQIAMLRAVCTLLSYTSHIQLDIFLSKEDFKMDRKHNGLKTAIAVIAPHGGALANILFVPNTTVVIELNDLQYGHWFYVHLATLLGLPYVPIPVTGYSHENSSHSIVANISYVVDMLKRHLPELSRFPPKTGDRFDHEHRAICQQKVDYLERNE